MEESGQSFSVVSQEIFTGHSISQSAPEKQKPIDCEYIEIYLKELAHMIMEADKSKICHPSPRTIRLEAQGIVHVSVHVQRSSADRLASCWRRSVFCFIQAFS